MTTYFIKVILCSGLLILVYKLLLENEKTHRFNRFYLLVSLLLSFFIPLVTIGSYTPALSIIENVWPGSQALSPVTPVQQSLPASAVDYSLLIFPAIYAAVTILLLIRFAIHLKAILYKIKTNTSLSFGNAQLVLVSEEIIPHSFLHFIFINRQAYTNQGIEKEILVHEMAHVEQKHSADVLFIEVL